MKTKRCNPMLNPPFFCALCLLLIGCKAENLITQESEIINFGNPAKVEVLGYDDHLMEPFLSRGGNILFFNNRNDPSENTNLHWAEKINVTV